MVINQTHIIIMSKGIMVDQKLCIYTYYSTVTVINRKQIILIPVSTSKVTHSHNPVEHASFNV